MPRTWGKWRVSQYIFVYSIKFSNLFWMVLLHLFFFPFFFSDNHFFLLVLFRILLTKKHIKINYYLNSLMIKFIRILWRPEQVNLKKMPRTWGQWWVSQCIYVPSIKFSNLFWTVLLHLFSFSIFLQWQSIFPFSFVRDPFDKESYQNQLLFELFI